MNPYKVLGIKEGASQEEIKRAYKQMVKKYHPDQYANNPLGELAEEKIKEINDAYNMLMSGNYNSSSGNSYNSSNNTGFNGVRSLINQNRLSEAENMLDRMGNQTAEWNYLKGIIHLKRGWINSAINFLNIACQMEPNNLEYRNTLNSINNRNNQYRTFGNNYGYNQPVAGGCCGSDPCSCCSNLVCADCCCECMGGDLISCC